MTITTHPQDRKEMVSMISAHLGIRSEYLRAPTYAFRIGNLTVNRDGTISSEEESALAAIRPMLVAQGWLDEEAADKTAVEPASEADACDEIARTQIAVPIEGWTVAQRINLLRMLCSRQYLINRMLESEMLYIEESFVRAISQTPPATASELEGRLQTATGAECIRGVSIGQSNATLTTPAVGDAPERWKAYVRLWTAILKSCETASRVSLKRTDDAENEKYHANSWLMRMDFGGPEYKETRRILMGHLSGFAAFKSAAEMEAHKEKMAQRRRDRREAAEQ